jgi:hypothetical protein
MHGCRLAICGGCRYVRAMTAIRCVVIGVLAIATAAPAPAPAAQQKKSAAGAPPPAAAPAAQTLGRVDSWTAYASQDSSGKVCYLVGQPRRNEPAAFARKPATAMVTHRPVEKIANVVSFVEGYPLKEGTEVALDIGGSKFELFTKDDSAWARTAELDKTIVATLAKGRQVVVKGLPQKGPATTDTYALSGFAKALALIDKACGVTRDEKPAAKPASRGRKKVRH